MSLSSDLSAVLADLPDLLTPREAADALRVDVRTVNRWRASGRLRSVKTSPGQQGRVLIPKAAVLAFLTGADND